MRYCAHIRQMFLNVQYNNLLLVTRPLCVSESRINVYRDNMGVNANDLTRHGSSLLMLAVYIDDVVQNGSNSSALATQLLQSCTKQSICTNW